MKRIFVLFILSITFGNLMAQALQSAMEQSTWPVVFDANWQVAKAPLAPAYYRDFKPFSDGSMGGNIRDYFISGKLQMDGTISSSVNAINPNEYIKDGIFTYYFENGKISAISFYRNNKLEGLRSTFYEDGTLNEEAFYASDKLDGDYNSYYKSGKTWFKAKYANGLLVNNLAEEFSETGEQAKVYVENFVSAVNDYNWPLGDYPTYSAKIEPMTGLKLTDKDNDRLGFHLAKPTILSGTPFSFSCKVSSLSGAQGSYYGLSFDFKDWENYKYFLISDKGNFAIGQYSNGTNSYIVTPASSDAVNKLQETSGYIYDNVNDLEIISQNGKTTFSVNKKVVYSTQTIFAGTGMFGLYIESGKKAVTFNQFIIKSK